MSTNLRNLDKYELSELLGRGGMAEVWKAKDTQLHRYVAIKLLHTNLQSDPGFLTRFVREARVIASLHHPNIVQIYDFQATTSPDTTSPIAYMVMEYVDGQTLAEYIRRTSRQGRFPSGEDLVQLFAGISRAIDYAHARGMVHRDIKPANILLDRRNTTHLADGEPILTDFGIVRLLGTSAGTLSHTWMGTPLYLSPEQAQGQPGNELSDIYSLGVILYEMCTGTQPFHGENVPAIIFQQGSAIPPSPELLNPQISPGLAGVICKAMAKDPAQRFPNASSLTAALAEALHQPVPADISQAVSLFQMQSSSPGLGSLSDPTRADSPNEETLPSPITSGSATFLAGQPVPLSPMQTPTSPSVTPASPGMATPTLPGMVTPGNLTPMQYPANLTPQGPAAYNTPIPSSSPENLPTVLRRKPSGLKGFSDLKNLSIFKRQPLSALLMIGLVLLLLASSIGGIYWLTHRDTGQNGAPAGKANVGRVIFTSSGLGSEQDNKGENDKVFVRLQKLPAPGDYKAYYAWLLSDLNNVEGAPIYLGMLDWNSGRLSHPFATSDHANLLANHSRFLITEESSRYIPQSPTLDHTAWRYYAKIPQIPNPHDQANHFSVLDYLRHLLVQDPELSKIGLPGGLDLWLNRNVGKVFEWSNSAQGLWEEKNADGVRNMVIRVLDYLDGAKYVQQDVPPGTPMLANPRNAQVALLSNDQTQQDPPSYIASMNANLRGLLSTPGVTAKQSQLATRISEDLNRVARWLREARQDAIKLINMSSGDLLSSNALGLLEDMQTKTSFAEMGRTLSDRNIEGAKQIYENGRRLASMTITAYHGE